MAVDLQLGAVDLLGSANTSPGWWIEPGGDDTSLGAPVDVERQVTSFLQDGAIVTVESQDNREMSIPLTIKATTVANLAAGEAALVAELGKRNLLTYTPSGNGSPCLFDVVTSSLAQNFDDVLEKNAIASAYVLTIKALPSTKSGTTTTTSWSAGGTTPAVTSIDTCTSTTNWTGSPNSPTTSGGAVRESQTMGGTQFGVQTSLTRSSMSAPMTTSTYIRVDMQVTSSQPPIGSFTAPRFYINGAAYINAERSDGNVYWVKCAPSTLTSLKVEVAAGLLGGTTVTLSINDLSRSTTPYDSSNARQTFMTVPVAGSARTQASLALADTSPSALGSTLIYTSPASVALAQPNLRARLSSGDTETTDASAVSGKTNPLSASLTAFDTPCSQVPSGGYLLLARVKNATTGTYQLTGSGYSVMGGNVIGSIASNPATFTLTAASVWTVVIVGTFTLPTIPVGSAGTVRVALSTPSSGLILDEAWLFNLDIGQLTWVECGTASPSVGGSVNRLWLDPATLSNPTPSIWGGTLADRSDQYSSNLGVRSFGNHQIAPPSVNVFTVTSNSTACTMALSYAARSHTRVA